MRLPSELLNFTGMTAFTSLKSQLDCWEDAFAQRFTDFYGYMTAFTSYKSQFDWWEDEFAQRFTDFYWYMTAFTSYKSQFDCWVDEFAQRFTDFHWNKTAITSWTLSKNTCTKFLTRIPGLEWQWIDGIFHMEFYILQQGYCSRCFSAQCHAEFSSSQHLPGFDVQ